MFLNVLLAFFTTALICRAAPTLEKEHCEKPGQMEGATLQGNWNAETYSPGTVAKFTCLNGHIRDGAVRMACIEGSWLDISKGQCKILGHCSKPPQIHENGELLGQWNDGTFPPGKVATYICRQGYSQSSPIKMACIEGEWITISKGFCNEDSKCRLPPKIKDGVIRGQEKTEYLPGEKVTYDCVRGYTMGKNINYITCEDSAWTAPPICRKVGQSCGPPPVVQFGDTIQKRLQSHRSDSSVTYKCANYYTLEGNQVITCKDGEWEKEPVCREPCIVKEFDMQKNNIHMKFKYREEKTKSFYSEHFDNMTFECKPGYEISDLKLLRAQCLDGEVKYPKCLKKGSCVLQLEEMTRNNIRYIESTELEHGQTILFECEAGMFPKDDLNASCVNKQIRYPKCSAGQPCTISANSMDEKHIELMSENVPEILNHGSEINVKCKANFKRPGILIASCYDGTMKYPRCFPGGTCRISQQDLDDNFLELDEVHENEVFYEEGETVRFQCKTGYIKRTGLTGTCTKLEKETQYTLTYPTCKQVGQSCGPPPVVQFGDIIQTRLQIYRSDSSVTYKCANYHKLEGNKEIKCKDGEWDKEPVCRIPCTVKETDMQQNNIQIKYKFGEDKTKKLYSEHLDAITFECKSGYQISDTKPLRVQCLDGVLKYPKCLKQESTV